MPRHRRQVKKVQNINKIVKTKAKISQNPEIPPSEPVEIDLEIGCMECTATVRETRNITQHFKSHHGREPGRAHKVIVNGVTERISGHSMCIYCGQYFVSEHYLHIHMNKNHWNQVDSKSEARFESLDDFETHLKFLKNKTGTRLTVWHNYFRDKVGHIFMRCSEYDNDDTDEKKCPCYVLVHIFDGTDVHAIMNFEHTCCLRKEATPREEKIEVITLD